jgi:hypothetical protein
MLRKLPGGIQVQRGCEVQSKMIMSTAIRVSFEKWGIGKKWEIKYSN